MAGRIEFEALLKTSDAIQRDDLFNGDGTVRHDKLLTWLLEQQPLNGKSMFPQALRTWISRILLLQASTEAAPAVETWERATQDVLKRAFGRFLDASERVWTLRTMGTFSSPWAFASLLAVPAIGRRPSLCSDEDLLNMNIAAFDTLPLAVFEAGSTQEWARHVVAGAAAAAAVLHASVEVRKAALQCFIKLSRRCSQLHDLVPQIEIAGKCVGQMLQGDLNYLNPPLRRATVDALSGLITHDDRGVADWMLVVLDGPQGMLHSSSAKLRIVAIFLLEHLVVTMQSPVSWDALAVCLQDLDPEVRGTACEVLIRVSRVAKGAGAILPLLQPMMEDASEDVRTGAMEVAASILKTNSLNNTELENARELVATVVGDTEPHLRMQAIQLCSCLGKFQQAVLPLVGLLQSDKEVGSEACRALASVTQRGSDRAMVALVAFFSLFEQSDTTSCKSAALRGLGEVAPFGHQKTRELALATLSWCLEIRLASIFALSSTCTTHDDEVVTALSKALNEIAIGSNADVLISSFADLSQDSALHAALVSCLGKKTHWAAKRTLLKSLSSASRGCSTTLGLVKPCLDDNNADVREMAVETIFEIIDPGNNEIVELLGSIRDMQEPNVQDAIDNGMDALKRSVAPGSGQSQHLNPDVQTDNLCGETLHVEWLKDSAAEMSMEDLLDMYDDVVAREKSLERCSLLSTQASSDDDEYQCQAPSWTDVHGTDPPLEDVAKMPIDEVFKVYDNIDANDVTLDDCIKYSRHERTCLSSNSTSDDEVSTICDVASMQVATARHKHLVAVHEAIEDMISKSDGCPSHSPVWSSDSMLDSDEDYDDDLGSLRDWEAAPIQDAVQVAAVASDTDDHRSSSDGNESWVVV